LQSERVVAQGQPSNEEVAGVMQWASSGGISGIFIHPFNSRNVVMAKKMVSLRDMVFPFES
jgi:hypothetical protein